MPTKLTKLPKSRVKLVIEIPAKEVEPIFERVYGEFAQKVEIAGFRPGKAPRTITIDAIGIGRLQNQVLEYLINDSYVKAMIERKLVPVGNPAISVQEFSIGQNGEPNDLKTTIEVDVLPEVKIDGYKSIKVKKPTQAPVDAKDVDNLIEHLRRQKADLQPVDRPAEAGDWIDIGFKGSVDGVFQENLVNDHFPLVIGSKIMAPGFEEELVGLKKSDKRTFNIIFPKNAVKEIAGKTVAFEVTAHDVRQVNLPPVDDKFAESLAQPTLLALRGAVRESLNKQREEQAQNILESQVIEAALEKFRADIPDSLIENEIDRMIERAADEAKAGKMPFEIYLEKINKTLGQLRQEFQKHAEQSVKVGLLLGELVKREGIDHRDENAAKIALERLVGYANSSSVSKSK